MSDTKQGLTSSLHSSYFEISCKVKALSPSTNSSYIARQTTVIYKSRTSKKSLYFHHSTYITLISVWIFKNMPSEINHILRLSRLMEYASPAHDFN